MRSKFHVSGSRFSHVPPPCGACNSTLGARDSAHSCEAGFTLLELVAVLFILTLGAALIAPRFGRSFGQVQLRAAARDVAALCRFARTQAISHQGVVEVVLDRRTNAYWLRGPDWIVGHLGGTTQVGTAEGPEQPSQARMLQARTRALPAGITLKSVVLDTGPLREDEHGAIAFFPQGSSTGGEVWVADEKGRGYRIMIDSSVGLVRVRAATTT
jgi:general secretion pathway protein H